MSINDTLKEIIDKNNNYGKNNIGNSQKINIEVSYNISNSLTDKDINKIIYMDNLSRIMEYCGYIVNKEIYIKTNNIENISNDTITETIEKIKKNIDYYRIKIDKYSTTKELEDKYIIEDYLTNLRYNDKCYVEDNNLLLKKDNNKYKLLDELGNYTNLSFDLTHIINKKKEGYDKILLIDNCYDNNIYELITESNNKKIEFIKLPGSNINIESIEDINNIRIININSKLNPEDLININSLNIMINKTINNNIKNMDEYNTLNDDISYNIINKLTNFDNIIIESCKSLNPKVLLDYITELTNLTNNYLIKEQNIDKNKIDLLKAIQIVYNNSLKILGVIPTE